MPINEIKQRFMIKDFSDFSFSDEHALIVSLIEDISEIKAFSLIRYDWKFCYSQFELYWFLIIENFFIIGIGDTRFMRPNEEE